MAERYVIDSSVVLRWYFDQVGYQHAREVRAGFVAGTIHLEAPDVLRWEVGNQLRSKGVDFRRLTEDDVVGALVDLHDLGLVVHDTSLHELLAVTRLSVQQGISMFDAAFVTVALRTGLTLLTADARLVRALDGLVSTELLRGVGRPALEP